MEKPGRRAPGGHKLSSGSAGGQNKPIGTNTLEKKNKDLNKATKELEAKVKNLQQKTRTLPKVESSRSKLRELPLPPPSKEEGRKGSTVTSRIREREADFQKQVVERDDQISRLKERLKILSTKECLHLSTT